MKKIKNDDYHFFFSDESKTEFKDNKITGLKLGNVKVDVVSKFNPNNFIIREILIK